MFDNLEASLKEDVVKAIDEMLQLLLTKPEINMSSILKTEEPVPGTDQIGQDTTLNLEDTINEIVGDDIREEDKEPLRNAFTDVLKSEYCRGNEGISSRMNSIIEMLYMKKDRFTEEQYKELNSLVYDTVMELFLEQDNVKHVTVDTNADRCRRFSGVFQTEGLNPNYVHNNFLYTHDMEEIFKSGKYTPRFVKPDKDKAYMGWNSEEGEGGFIFDSYNGLRSNSILIDKLIAEYNKTVEDDEKLDDQVMYQLDNMPPSVDEFNFKSFSADVLYASNTMRNHLYKVQQIIIDLCLYSIPSWGWIMDLRRVSHHANPDSPIDWGNQESESCEELYNCEDIKRIIDKYFHRETALEDLINFMWLSCSSEEVEDEGRPMPTVSPVTKSIYRSDIPNELKNKTDRISNFLGALLSPLRCVKFGSLRTSAPIYKDSKLRATEWYGRLRNNFALIPRLPAILSVASGEAALKSLSEKVADELISLMKEHPTYNFMKNHEDATIEDVRQLLNGKRFESIINKTEYDKKFPRDDAADLSIAYVNKVYKALSRLSSAMFIILSLISHKLFATSEGAVLGLSSDLVHTIHSDTQNNAYSASSWVYSFAWLGDAPYSVVDRELQSGRIAEKALSIKKEFCDDPSKPLLVLQDSASGIMHTGAPIIRSNEEIMTSQDVNYRIRETLKKSFYVIANTKAYTAKETKYMLAMNTFRATPGLTATNVSRAKSLNRKLVGAKWWTRDNINTKLSSNYSYLPYCPAVACMDGETIADTGENSPLHSLLSESAFSGTVLTYFGSKPYDKVFAVRDCPIPLRGDVSGSGYDYWASSKDASCNSEGFLEQDPSTIVGGTLGCNLTGGHLVPNTIWTSSYICRLTQGPNRLKAFPKNALMSATLCSLDVVPMLSVPWPAYVDYPSNPIGRGGVPHLFPVEAKPLAYKFNLEDLIRCDGAIPEVEDDVETDTTVEDFQRTHLVSLDWRAIYSGRSRNPSHSIGREILRKVESYFEGSQNIPSSAMSIHEYTERFLSDIGRVMIVRMYTDDITRELVVFGDLDSNLERPAEIKEEMMKLSDWVSVDRAIPLSPIKVEKTTGPKDNTDINLMKSSEELPDSTEAFLHGEQKEAAAVDIVRGYNKYISDNMQRVKLRPAQEKVSLLEKEAELLQAKLRQAQKQLKKVNDEMDRITKEGLDANGTVQSRLRSMINKGYLLDYKLDTATGDMIIVTKAPTIWVGGLIYVFSPAMIRLKLGEGSILEGMQSSEGRPTIFATKDLQYMRGEAYRLFGKKYGLTSYKRMRRASESLSLNISSYSDVYDYPHVHQGTGCLGKLISLFKQNLKDGDLAGVISSLLYYLNTVNIQDPWGETIKYWPAIPATMFNLLKCGLLQDTEEYRNQYIVIPGKYLETKSQDCYWYSDVCKRFPSGIPAMINIKDMTPEILQYLYDEASCLQNMGYEHDYDYLRSFSDDYWYNLLISASVPYLTSVRCLEERYSRLADKDVKAYLNIIAEYAYNIYQPGLASEQERSWRFLENSIANIDVWRRNIRYVPTYEDAYTNQSLECQRKPLNMSLSEDKVIVSNC